MVSRNKPTVSMALVMDRLREITSEITDTRNTLDDLLQQRDAMVTDMKALGLPERTIMKLTGLSRTQVTRIVTHARQTKDSLHLAELVSSPR